jgi:hypothetical protein
MREAYVGSQSADAIKFELTGDFGSGPEPTSIGGCRLFRLLAEN